MLTPPARVLQRLHRLRQHAELQPPGRPQVHPRLPALLGARRCTSTASGSTWRRSSPSTSDQQEKGQDADHPRDRVRPGPVADQADRRALEHPPVPARVSSPTAAGPSGTASSATRSASSSRGTPGSPASCATRVAGSYDLFAPDARLGALAVPQHQLRHLPRRLHAQRPRLVQREAQRAQRRGEPRRRQRQRELELRLRGVTSSSPTCPTRRRTAIEDAAPPADQELPDDPLPLAGDADAPLRRRDAADRRGGQQHRLPGQLAELDQLGERQAARRDPPLHQADHRLPQAAPDRPPLALHDRRRGRDADPAQHHLARREARARPTSRARSRFIAWVLEAFQTDQRGDVPIYVGLECLLGADHRRAARDRRASAGIASSTPRSPPARTSSPRRRPSSSPRSTYVIQPRIARSSSVATLTRATVGVGATTDRLSRRRRTR